MTPNKCIQESISADTFILAIDEAVKATGIKDVLNTNITWCRFPLISGDKSIYTAERYKNTIKQCECGLFVNTCSSNIQKKKLLDNLFQKLGLDNWTVTIV